MWQSTHITLVTMFTLQTRGAAYARIRNIGDLWAKGRTNAMQVGSFSKSQESFCSAIEQRKLCQTGQLDKIGQQDPLQPISVENAGKLLQVLRSDFPHSLEAYGHVQNFINWSKTEDLQQSIEIYTPAQSHFTDGVIIGIYKATDLYHFITIHSMSRDTSALRDAFLTTSRIKWDTEGLHVAFEGLTKKCLPIVEECLTIKKLKTTLRTPSVKLWKPLENHTFGYTCPPEIVIAPLDIRHSKEIEDHWVHRFKNAETHIKRLITNNFGLGFFLRSSGELITWNLVNHSNGFSLLHVKQDHHGKNYASLMTQAMGEEMYRLGLLPQGNIAAFNKPALKMGQAVLPNCCEDFFFVYAKAIDARTDGHRHL